MPSQRPLDVIIFGATGFTGSCTVYEAVKLLEDLRWGVAGRNQEKLAQVLQQVGRKTGVDLSRIPTLIADVNDPGSLKKMAEQCQIVVNCCGPYRLFGEPVVKACVEAGTHHVDISGEAHYMERMQLLYHAEAQQKGVYVVSACGFDSIPGDMGVVFLENEFNGTVNSVETFLEKSIQSEGGALVHYGTWESAIHALSDVKGLLALRKQLFKTRLPSFQPPLKARPLLHRSKVVNGLWCLPRPGTDQSVVRRTQRYFYENYRKRPIQMRAYLTFSSFLEAFSVILIGTVCGLMTWSRFGRKLLLKYPRFFSAGLVSREGPSEEALKNTEFNIYIVGEGWDRVKNRLEPSDESPNKQLIVRVSGTNPGYGATCVALLLSAKTILGQSDKMPASGGVLTPGAAFYKTNLIEDLCKNGFKFETVNPNK
ncbi:saccharopine dehydrogenase-like oxidoreductase [Aedes albopictus]|uniref:Saccharopine dehydrogenase NADP binding domain-containing protein n=1 Tax=Aedes albopictus TaxID=7160 RepID=A0ABM1YDT8_AEDAL